MSQGYLIVRGSVRGGFSRSGVRVWIRKMSFDQDEAARSAGEGGERRSESEREDGPPRRGGQVRDWFRVRKHVDLRSRVRFHRVQTSDGFRVRVRDRLS